MLTCSGPEKRCSDPTESRGRGRHPSLIYESDPLNPAELKDTNWEFSPHRAQFGCCFGRFCKPQKKWLCIISTWRGEEKRGRGSCLLCGRRTTVLLVGVEGFPHSGFRHFIRYVNIRGVRPEERAEEEEESRRGEVGAARGERLVAQETRPAKRRERWNSPSSLHH